MTLRDPRYTPAMVDPDTSIGGGHRRFGTTQWSQILGFQAGEGEARREALESLVRVYWKPVYYYVRLQWGRTNEDAKDLTQRFFAWMIDGDVFDRPDRDRGRFRSFLKVSLRNFMTNEAIAEQALKRGGGRTITGLEELARADLPMPAARSDPAEVMDREWKRALVARALGRLQEDYRRLGKERYFEVFHDCSFGAPGETHEAVAARAGVTPVDVKNYLADARRRFRQVVHDLVAETVSDAEGLRDELRELFGEEMTG